MTKRYVGIVLEEACEAGYGESDLAALITALEATR